MDQSNDMNCSGGANSCKMLPMASKAAWATAAVMAGATLLGAAAYLAWNSRQAKMQKNSMGSMESRIQWRFWAMRVKIMSQN